MTRLSRKKTRLGEAEFWRGEARLTIVKGRLRNGLAEGGARPRQAEARLGGGRSRDRCQGEARSTRVGEMSKAMARRRQVEDEARPRRGRCEADAGAKQGQGETKKRRKRGLGEGKTRPSRGVCET